MSGTLSKSAFFEGVGHFERRFQTERKSLTNHCWYQKTAVIVFRAVSKYMQCIVWFCQKARV